MKFSSDESLLVSPTFDSLVDAVYLITFSNLINC